MASKTVDPNDWKVSATVLADALGVDRSRVSQLTGDGVFRPERRGKVVRYPLIASVRAYCDQMRKRNVEKDELSRRKLVAEVEYREAKAEGEKLRTRQRRGELHDARDVRAATDQLVQTIKSMLVALPSRLAVDVMAAKSAPEASQIISRETNRIQSELANFRYDPEVYRRMLDGGEPDDV